MADHKLLANIIRAMKDDVKTFGASLTPVVLVKNSDLRDPLKQGTEDECFQFRFDHSRHPKTRVDQPMIIATFEIHCWSKRGDQRNDKASDRHIVLATMVQEHFQQRDVQVYDALGGNTHSLLGVFGIDDTSVSYRDKRNTIYGQAVDYSIETPTTLQAVVVVSGLLIRGA